MLIDSDSEAEDSEIIDPCGESDITVRLQLLNLAKEVLQHKAAMRWETHKQIEDVTIDQLILEAKKLYSFVTEK